MNETDYYSIKMLSNSALKNFSEYSPRKAMYLYENGIKETEALLFGRMIHKQVFEAGEFLDEFEYLPEGFSLKTKANKQLYQKIIDSGKTPVKPAQKTLLDNLCNRILESKNAEILLRGLPEKEFFGELAGEKIKSKLDLINPDKGYILDLKTTQNAEPHAFVVECEKRQYFQQAWLYTELARQNGQKINKFFFLNIEKEPPYSMSIVEVSKVQFDIGYEQFNHNLAMYKRAKSDPFRDFDKFPDGQKHFQYLLPDWAERKYNLNGED